MKLFDSLTDAERQLLMKYRENIDRLNKDQIDDLIRLNKQSKRSMEGDNAIIQRSSSAR